MFGQVHITKYWKSKRKRNSMIVYLVDEALIYKDGKRKFRGLIKYAYMRKINRLTNTTKRH